jgi:hypothetical protein
MRDARFAAIRDLIQADVNQRGLRSDPVDNLIHACPEDLEEACRSIVGAASPGLGIITGFYIPGANPPAGETDGPLGALFLARALTPLGIRVVIGTDPFCALALQAGLEACGLRDTVPLLTLAHADDPDLYTYAECFDPGGRRLTHWVALERAGPSHTPATVQSQRGATSQTIHRFVREVPPEHHDRCHNMRGGDLTAFMRPAHLLFEGAKDWDKDITTIGIGDGGNEIGMGKIAWETIRRNIPNGGLIACRVPCDHLIVCGVSNWGAYGLAAGICLLRGEGPPGLFDVERERELLQIMIERGPLVDGVTGTPTLSVDGLPFERYAEPLRRLGEMLEGKP